MPEPTLGNGEVAKPSAPTSDATPASSSATAPVAASSRDREALALGLVLAAWTVGLSLCYAPHCPTFLQGDLGNDLSAYRRVLSGEVPYRDFLWGYGPAMPYLFAASLRFFGDNLAVIQAAYFFFLSLSALATYRLALRVLPPAGALVAGLCLFFVAFVNHAYNHVGCTLAGTLATERFLAWRASGRTDRIPWSVAFGLAACAAIKLNAGLCLGGVLALAHAAAALVRFESAGAPASPGTPAVQPLGKRMAGAVLLSLRWGLPTLCLTCLFYGYFLLGLDREGLAHAFPYGASLDPPRFHKFLLWVFRTPFSLAQSLLAGDWNGFAGGLTRVYGMSLAFVVVSGWAAWKALAFASSVRVRGRGTGSFDLLVLALVAVAYSAEFLLTGHIYNLYYYSGPALVILVTKLLLDVVRWLLVRLGRGGGVARPVATALLGTAVVVAAGVVEVRTHVFFADHPRLRVYLENDGNTDMILRVTRFVEGALAPGEPLVIVPYAPLFYFLTARPNPLWTDMWQRHNGFTPAEEADLLERVERRHVRCVLLHNLSIDRNPFSGTFGVTHALLLAPYLREHFDPLGVIGDGPGWEPPQDWMHGQRIMVLWRMGVPPPPVLPR